MWRFFLGLPFDLWRAFRSKEANRGRCPHSDGMWGCDPEARIAGMRGPKASHARKRLEVYAKYGGARCAECSETEWFALQLDHVDPADGDLKPRYGGGKEKGARVTGNPFVYWLAREGCPAGIRVLCANCNQEKGGPRG